LPRRPKTLANIFPIITAEAANLADVGIGPAHGLSSPRQTRSRRRCGGRSTSAASAVASHFVPPHIAIESSCHIHRQVRSLDLDMRIAVAGQRHRATEIAALDELGMRLLVPPGRQQRLERLASSRKIIAPEVTPCGCCIR